MRYNSPSFIFIPSFILRLSSISKLSLVLVSYSLSRSLVFARYCAGCLYEEYTQAYPCIPVYRVYMSRQPDDDSIVQNGYSLIHNIFRFAEAHRSPYKSNQQSVGFFTPSMILAFSGVSQMLISFSLFGVCESLISRCAGQQKQSGIRGGAWFGWAFQIMSSEQCCRAGSETAMLSITISQQSIGSF